MEWQGTLTHAGVNANSTAILENSLVIYWKSRDLSLNQITQLIILKIFTQWVKNICQYKNRHLTINICFIDHHQKLEEANIPCSTCMDKLTGVHTMKYYSVIKSNEVSHHRKTRRKLKSILLCKKAVWKCFILYGTNYMRKKQNYEGSKLLEDIKDLGMNRWSTKDFQDSEMILHDS